MSKSTDPKPKAPTFEQRVVTFERTGNGHYRVLEGTVRGGLEDVKVLEEDVPLHQARIRIAMRRKDIADTGMP